MLKKIIKFLFIAIISLALITSIIIKNPGRAFPIKWQLQAYYKYYTIKSRFIKHLISYKFTYQALEKSIQVGRETNWIRQQIAADLLPFNSGITSEQVNSWYTMFASSPNNRLIKITINNHQVKIENRDPELLQKRSYQTIVQLINYLASHKLLPDCAFLIALNDYLTDIPFQAAEPVAIFTFAKDIMLPIEQNTILVPDWMNIRGWDITQGRIELANKLYPWKNKQPLIHYRGSFDCNQALPRKRFINLKHDLKFIDAEFITTSKDKSYILPEFSIAYKYQISIDGARATWERMIWQLHSNCVLIFPQSSHKQWFHSGIHAFKHYVPLKSITKEDVESVYQWLKEHDKEAEKISHNANVFAKNYLNTQDFYAYYAILIQEYAKLYKN